jgi:hypothetical protein
MLSPKSRDLIGIIVPICGGVLGFIGIFFYPGSFFIHPTFDVKVDDSGNITITNTGWIQAKDVKVQLSPTDLLGLTYTSCPELTNILKTNYTNIVNALTKDDSTKFTYESALEFDRMSSNLPCEIKPANNEGILTKVTVTADNSPAFVWTKESNQTKNLTDTNQIILDLTIILVIVSMISAISSIGINRFLR